MPYPGCRSRSVFVCIPICIVCAFDPTNAWADERDLRLPTIAASAAAAVDWATTYHALKYYKVHETNPLLRRFDTSPGKLVSLGGVMDAGLVSGWNLTVGRKRPGLAIAGLWAMTAFRAYLAIHNLHNTRQAERR
jgi:hypothetical protein